MKWQHMLYAPLGAMALLGPITGEACTSLLYGDANNRMYAGRTVELGEDMPYQLSYVPAGRRYSSSPDQHVPLEYTSRFGMLVITLPFRAPTPGAPLVAADQKVLEGMNDRGMTFSLLAYASAKGPRDTVAKTRQVLSALDLGTWALGQFESVAALKAALERQPVILAPLARLGGGQPPVHFTAHDRSGASIVIEYQDGKQNIYDNPTGVMTNGPSFPWHLTNLGNYTYLDNVDKPETTFGRFVARQPDAGSATAGLPSSDTSVGRFVRAAYYSKFAQKVRDPDQAVLTLAHVMNNFDRPKDITIDLRGGGAEGGGSASGSATPTTEYTSVTVLSDLERTRFYVRDYGALNYTGFDLVRLGAAGQPRTVPLAALTRWGLDGTDALLRSNAP